MNKALIIIFFTFSSIYVYGQNHSYFHACFSSKSVARSALTEISFIKAKEDRIKTQGHCVDFYINKVREELYTKFLQVKFGGKYKLSNSMPSDTKQCKLELIKDEVTSGDNNTFKIGTRVKLNKQNNKSKSRSAMSIYISHGTTGAMVVDNERYTIACKVTGAGYNLTIKTTSPDITLSTSRFVPFGGSIELGDFIQNSTDKLNEVSTKRGIKKGKVTNKKYSSIKLVAK